MSKAPMVVDIVLGEMQGTIVGTEEGSHVNLYGSGNLITSEQLRNLADKIDKMDAASKIFFGTDRTPNIEYAITFCTNDVEDSVVITASSPVEAAKKFFAVHKTTIKAMYDRIASTDIVVPPVYLYDIA